MKTVQLTKGKFAIVDDEDYELVNKYRWHCTSTNYASYKGKDRKEILMHRLILGLSFGDKLCADHINHNTLDNRKENLRVSTYSQNTSYSKNVLNIHNSSDYRGVSWKKNKNRWMAHIKVNGKDIFICYSLDKESAAREYDRAAKTYFGEFARLNFAEEINENY